MYKTKENKYYLQLFFRQPNREFPDPEAIEKCGKKCTIEEFFEVKEEVIPDKPFEEACKLDDNPDKPVDPEKPDPEKPNPEKPGKGDKPGKPNDKPDKQNSASINSSGQMFSIILCSLWFIRRFF